MPRPEPVRFNTLSISAALLFLLLACWNASLTLAEQPAVPLYPPPAEVRTAFLKLLDRPKIEPNAQVQVLAGEEDGLVREQISFASERKADGQIERVPALLIRPAKTNGKLPAVIVLHGTGGNKEGQAGWLAKLAKQGIMSIAVDARYHGARAGGKKGTEAYVDAIVRVWQTSPSQPHEHPFYYDTCWDLWRTIDYLQSRPDVDGDRLGMIGFSMGGIQTWLAAAVDDRIKVAVPAISVQSFRWSLENDKWQGRARTIRLAHDTAAKDLGESEVNQKVCRTLWNKIIPGMLDRFDCPSMLRLFADRPLLILNGENDLNCPLGGAKLAFASAEATYKQAGAQDRLQIIVAEGVGHRVTPQQDDAALAWFVKWLAKK
jgi:dienelactone hydrolase